MAGPVWLLLLTVLSVDIGVSTLQLNTASVSELEEYERYLSSQLKKVANILQNSRRKREITTNETSTDSSITSTTDNSTTYEDNSITLDESTTTTTTPSTTITTTTPATNLSTTEETTTEAKTTTTTTLPTTVPKESAFFLNRIGALKKTIDLGRNETSHSIDQPAKSVDEGQYANISEALKECKRLTQPELVAELKQKGTYNPELMAWDALGVIRFLDRTIHEQYQKEPIIKKRSEDVIERNVEALARLLKELNVSCDVTTPAIRAKLQNLTYAESGRSVLSLSLRRSKRMSKLDTFMSILNGTLEESFRAKDQPLSVDDDVSPRQKLIGESHVVPFGCDKRGAEEDGYLRLCGACQAIRRLPDTFFPPFINEVTCDTDRACLYFYDYPHGKCRQKHMNFVVLRNVGTKECQIWKKFNLNVRVSCECFVDEMSFFSKYV